MKYHKIPILGMLAGLIIMICSIVRWFFIWYDPSQMIIGVTLGGLISVLAYIYNWMKSQEENNSEINKRIDSFTKWMGSKELE